MVKTIELDCAPGTPRPDSYIEGVLEGTGISVEDGKIVSKFFGNWTWDFSEVNDDVWLTAQSVFEERITSLYNRGRIRYGSW